MSPLSRRGFLAGSGAAVTQLSFLSNLGPVSAEEAKLDPTIVRFQPEIEPLVRLLEESPRDQLLEKVAARIADGTTYREILAALLLAGVRNVQPRPSVGFKFHAVLVVNSAHLASLASPPEDRWLPIFWALDQFKSSQARDVSEGNWTMAAVNEAAIPSANLADDAFRRAMGSWDVEAADAAVAGLARSANPQEVLETFAYFGMRDFRSIGHKAIFVANSWRTLQHIGWQHGEPVLRSLAYALLNHEGEPNPSQRDLSPDRPWRRNQELAAKLADGWDKGDINDDATTDLIRTLRTGSDVDACDHVVKLCSGGVSPQSVFDALLVGAGELLMRQPGIVALHAVTSTNALYYAFRNVKSDESRRLLMLQNAAFLPLFREAMKGRGEVANETIEELQPIPIASKEAPLDEVFADVHGKAKDACGKTLGYLANGNSAEQFANLARRMIFLKGRDSHDYKFSSAVLEDYQQLSPKWRNTYLATSVFKLRGSAETDSPLVERTRDALT